MTELAQHWLAGLIGLGALYLVATQGKGIATALGGAQQFISGTEATAITGKA
jgi:hypothetical protein